LLLHVVDASSPGLARQMEVVGEVLAHLGVNDKPTLTVYNKCDVADHSAPDKDSVSVSAITGMGIEALQGEITHRLSTEREKLSVLLPLDSGALVSHVYANGQVMECQYRDDGIRLMAAVNAADAARLREAAVGSMGSRP
jgi:GTP-binding protein HflX